MTETSWEKESLAEHWNFFWPIIDVYVGGKSSIDLPELTANDWDDATNFIIGYGYNPDNKRDQRLIHSVFVEALNFIEAYLLPFVPGSDSFPPEAILDCDDVRTLLLYASGHESVTLAVKQWSCAVLRVMHTIAHLDGVERRVDMHVAKEQIHDRFKPFVNRHSDGGILFGDDVHHVGIDHVEWKTPKTRESIILKLLHKRGNVAETIYDLLGVRIITKRLCDVMQILRLMRKFDMVAFPNCNPGRARNTLIDVARFRDNIGMLLGMLSTGKVNEREFDSMIDRLTERAVNLSTVENPHSAMSYHSIQLTCRQLVRQKNPLFAWSEKLREFSRDGACMEPTRKIIEQIVNYAHAWPGLCKHEEVFSFYPFEVQIMDRTTYDEIQSSDAAHNKYKQSQVRAARRRVLGELLKVGSPKS